MVRKLCMVMVIVLALSGVAAAMEIVPSVSVGWSTTTVKDGLVESKFSSRHLGVTISAFLTDRIEAQVGYIAGAGGDLTNGGKVEMQSNDTTDFDLTVFYDLFYTNRMLAGVLVDYNTHTWKPHEKGGTQETYGASSFGVGGYVAGTLDMVWAGVSYIYRPSVTWDNNGTKSQGTGTNLVLFAEVPVLDWLSVGGSYIHATRVANDDERVTTSGFTVGASVWF